MKAYTLSPKFHAANRQTLAESLGSDAIVIIDTADPIARGDFALAFRPDPNFYYLTGITEPEAVLILLPGNKKDAPPREWLFVSGTTKQMSTWDGERLTPQEASSISGITSVLPLAELDSLLEAILGLRHTIYMNTHEALDPAYTSPSLRRAKKLKHSLPLHEFCSVLPELATQRMTKDPVEIKAIQAAIEVTAAGLDAAYRVLPTSRNEADLAAEFSATLTRAGVSEAFPSIIASGISATVIHYVKNNSPLSKDGLVLFDVGAEVGCYAADVSRTVPVNGRFTKRQRTIYEAVHKVQLDVIASIKPGILRSELEHAASMLLYNELVNLQLLKPAADSSKLSASEQAALRSYYPHAVSHHLGLDTHDAADYDRPLGPGMVITVEPGLYLKDERIGVRIEDDVLVTVEGHEVLSKAITADPNKLEALIKKDKS